MVIHNPLTARTTQTGMDTRNPITLRRITRIDIPSRTSQIDTPIHGRIRRIDITTMAIALVIARIESKSESGCGNRFLSPIESTQVRGVFMKRKLLLLASALLIVSAFSAAVLAQGRGRGVGLGRRSDVFADRGNARGRQWDNRGAVQDWKCGKFVNCHDARNGRWDGRGPKLSSNRRSRNDVFVQPGVRVRSRVGRNSDRYLTNRARLNRLEMLRQERIGLQRYVRNRRAYGRP